MPKYQDTQLEKRELVIESISPFRSGKKQSTGESWTLFNVIANGKKYSTFLDNLQIGETNEFLISEKKNGKYTNYQIVAYAKKRIPIQPTGSPTEACKTSEASPQTIFTEEDRQFIKETFEMVRALYDNQGPL